MSEKQSTWGGRFHEPTAEAMLRFSESVSFDRRLAHFDVAGSRAHAAMLNKVGLLSDEEYEAILAGLSTILARIDAGQFEWSAALEDVHMNIERALTAITPAGEKLHTARSRNDQVATDMRLFFKVAANEILDRMVELKRALVAQAGEQVETWMPAYTHLQRAQPVSMAHHLLAYVEMLSRDAVRFRAVVASANVSPLGSGAVAGTTLPIDRETTAQGLAFVDAAGEAQLTMNSMDAVADRDCYLDFVHACTVCGLHLSRLAEDAILWSTREFNFVRFSDAYTTGSSLMPQKKNPDCWELIRGKAARLAGNQSALVTLVKGLPLTYNRDLQEDKPPVFDSFDTLAACLEVATGAIQAMEVNVEACRSAVSDPLLLATDLVDYLVRKGKAFREAHHAVGALVARAEELQISLKELSFSDVQAVEALFEEDWVECFQLDKAMALRDKPGMPGPARVREQIARWQAELSG